MTSTFAHLFFSVRAVVKPIWESNIVIHLKKDHTIKVGYAFLLIVLILIIGVLFGLSLAKFQLTKQVLSAPVFASIIGVGMAIFGLSKIEIAKFNRTNGLKKIEIISKVLFLKEEFSEKTIQISKEIIQYFGSSNLFYLHNLLLSKLLKENEAPHFKALEFELNLNICSINGEKTIIDSIHNEQLLQRIFWFFELFLEGNYREKLLNYRVLISDIFLLTTDTIPGIFCRIEDTKSARKIYETKGRNFEKPLAIYSTNPFSFVHENPLSTAFYNAFKESPVTLVLKAKNDTPKLAIRNNFTGIRLMNSSSKLYKFLNENGLTLMGTSANVSGKTAPKNLSEIDGEVFSAFPSLNFEENSTKNETSVIKIEDDRLIILRKGFDVEKISKWAEMQEGRLVSTFEDGEEKITYIINKFK